MFGDRRLDSEAFSEASVALVPISLRMNLYVYVYVCDALRRAPSASECCKEKSEEQQRKKRLKESNCEKKESQLTPFL